MRSSELLQRLAARGSFARKDRDHDYPQIVIRFDKDTFQQVQRFAAKHCNNSFNQAVNVLVECALDEWVKE